MAREIKFRAKSDGIWVYGELHLMCRMPHIHCPEARPIKTDTVGQFSGLRDKYGKEIYEGDVVRWRRLKSKDEVDEQICYIGFHALSASFRLITKDSDYAIGNRGIPTDCFEVIGNMWDNRELITWLRE